MNTILIKTLNRLGLLKKVNVESTLQIGGTRIRIPILGGTGLYNTWLTEFWMSDLIRYAVSVNTGFFMDIGANIGQTLIRVRSIHRDLPYVGFEPNPEGVHYINRLIKLNDFKNVEIFPVGLFNHDAVLSLTFYKEVETDESASVVDQFREGAIYKKINVPVFNYNSIESIRALGKMAIIKIDVEGAESEVLTSLKNAINKHQPIIFVEILPAYSDSSERVARQDRIVSLMRELNFDILRIHKNNQTRKVNQLEKISGIEVHSNMDFSDYALVPAALSNKMISHFNRKSS